jgi:hypothetical protein
MSWMSQIPLGLHVVKPRARWLILEKVLVGDTHVSGPRLRVRDGERRRRDATVYTTTEQTQPNASSSQQ